MICITPAVYIKFLYSLSIAISAPGPWGLLLCDCAGDVPSVPRLRTSGALPRPATVTQQPAFRGRMAPSPGVLLSVVGLLLTGPGWTDNEAAWAPRAPAPTSPTWAWGVHRQSLNIPKVKCSMTCSCFPNGWCSGFFLQWNTLTF